jgi:hypothetical protein
MQTTEPSRGKRLGVEEKNSTRIIRELAESSPQEHDMAADAELGRGLYWGIV